MRQPYSEIKMGPWRLVLWALAILVIGFLIIYATWGCFNPDTGSTGVVTFEEEVVE